MSQLTEKYLAETGEKAMYRMQSSDYHTLRYVNWLEKLVEGVQTQTTNNARDEILPGQCPACHGCGNVMVSHVNECYQCNGTGKTSPVA
jgi:DnaJ-class molecular chaperone